MANAALAKLFVQHLIGLNQLENLSRERVVALIKEAFLEVNKTLTSGPELTKFQRARQLALFKRSGDILQQAYGDVAKVTNRDLFELGKMETRFVERVMHTSVAATDIELNTTRLGTEQLKKIIELPIQGHTNSQWWEAQAMGMNLQTRRQIQLGLFSGQSVGDIAKRITDVTANRAKNEATAIVRTAVTGVSAETQFASFAEQGDDITSEYEFVVTLDENTCEICGDYDGEQFSYDDETAPRPPLHINCRCAIVAVINWKGLGVNPSEVPELKAVERAAQDGPTKYKTYEQWLRKQPLDVKQDVLGKTKGSLFHDRDISLKDIVNNDRTIVTTKELAARLGADDKSLGAKARHLIKLNAGLILPDEEVLTAEEVADELLAERIKLTTAQKKERAARNAALRAQGIETPRSKPKGTKAEPAAKLSKVDKLSFGLNFDTEAAAEALKGKLKGVTEASRFKDTVNHSAMLKRIADLVPDAEFTNIKFAQLRDGLNGYYDPDGKRIRIAQRRMTYLNRYAEGDRDGATWGGIRTIVHESLHSRSPINNPKLGGYGEYTRKWGAEIEEAVVESTARKLTDAIWEGKLPIGREESYGSYRHWVTPLQRIEEYLPGTTDELMNLPTTAKRAHHLADKVRLYIERRVLPKMPPSVRGKVESNIKQRGTTSADDFLLKYWRDIMLKDDTNPGVAYEYLVNGRVID